MEKPSGQGEQSRKSDQDLAKSIKKMISKSVKELIAECREKLKEIDSTNVSNPTPSEPFQRQYQDADSSHIERKQKGRGIKNQVVGEKVVFFSLPDGFDAEHIRDLDKVRERLGEWKIQRRKRGSKMKLTDTYYHHLCSSVTLRSVNEVAEYIISDSLPKVNQKRKEVDHNSESSSSKKARKNKTQLEALPDAIGKGENISAEVRALTSTESGGANILTTEANAEQSQVVKENSEKVGNAKRLDVIDVDEEDDIFNQLQDLKLDWKSNYGISSEACFDENGMLTEVHIQTTEASDEESQNMEAKSKEQRCGQEFETLDEAAKRVEEDDFSSEGDIFDQLEDLSIRRKSSNYGISDAYLGEYDDRFTNISIYNDVTDLF